MTRSALAAAEYSVETERAFRIAAARSSDALPRLTAPSINSRARLSAALAASPSHSMIDTSKPAMSAAMEMPVPIRPPPTTAMRLISFGLPAATAAGLRTDRSAKNACRSALLSSEFRSRKCKARSFGWLMLNSHLAASSISRLCSGAAAPLAALVATARFASAHPCGTGGAARRETAMRSGRARDCAAFKGSSAIWSTPPTASRSSAVSNLPRQTISNAISHPISLGARCVPPAPGTKPILTSGNPNRVFGAATRATQAIASSKPPPRTLPWSAATKGVSLSSIACTISGRCGGSGSRLNSVISPPATKVRPVAVRIARSHFCTFEIASSRAARTRVEVAFTGGLSIRTMVHAPETSV